MSFRHIAFFALPLLIQFGTMMDVRAESAIPLTCRLGHMLESDLVLRGSVKEIRQEVVPLKERPMMAQIFSRVSFTVTEVIFGSFTGTTCEFFVSSNSAKSLRLEPGDQAVVSLVFDPEFQGGAYCIIANNACFVLRNGEWINQSPYFTAALTLAGIRSIVAPFRIEAITASSDIIAVGTVTSIQEEALEDPELGTAQVLRVTIEAEEFVKGAGAGSTLTFQLFDRGSYCPPWAAAPPPKHVEPGKRYCVFLVEQQGMLHSNGGVNGFFAIEKGGLVRNGIVLPTSMERVRRLVKE